MTKASTKHARACQNFNLADRGILKGAVIFDMAANQFNDLEAVDLVREATAAEVSAARAPAKAKRDRKTTATKKRPSATKAARAPAAPKLASPPEASAS